MKIKIDTEKKIISVEENCNLGTLVGFLKNTIPAWEEYEIETNVTVTWSYPVYPYRPYYPYYPYWYNTGATVMNTDISNGYKGTYNTHFGSNCTGLASCSTGDYTVTYKQYSPTKTFIIDLDEDR